VGVPCHQPRRAARDGGPPFGSCPGEGVAMDGREFDLLARIFASSPVRRTLLRGLTAGLAGHLIVSVGRSAAANCKPYGRGCGGNGDCCSESCIDGRCACRVGKSRCGPRCVDLRFDESHCGSCDTPCPEDLICRDGRCGCANFGATCHGDATCCSQNCVEGRCACRPIHTRCGNRCVDLRWDLGNCGTCGRACPQSQDLGLTRVCRAGACVCTPGTADCAGNGYCVDLNSDPANCGRCGKACATGERCDQGVCR
jgi:hypothetical protein